MQVLNALWRDDSAQDTSEYALLLLLITVALVGAVAALSGQIVTVIDTVKNTLVPK
jgi:Flp pilus assembly pilin Flp